MAWLALALPATAPAQVGREWQGQQTSYADPVTGFRILEITRGTNAADNLYFHVSNFTADNRNLLFVWDVNGASELCRAEVETGRVVQLTDGGRVAARTACPDPRDATTAYVMQGPVVIALNLLDGGRRPIGEIPGPRMGGYSQPTPTPDGRSLAVTKQRDEANWEIGLMEISTGTYRTVLTQGFRIGHVQHSPVDKVIFYAWETSGYAPQRSWLVNDDGSGNRPFYYRVAATNWFTPLKEWVTHEAWIQGTGDMTMINDKLGVMRVSRDGTATLVREGNYWHAASRPDGRVLVMDDAQGRLWLCETATGNIRLLATHLRDAVKIHSHPSFDRTGRYVQFHTGHTHETVALIDLATLPGRSWEY
jgi:oligogalacturonide lyase